MTINLSRLVGRILDSLNAGNGGWRKTLVHFILQLETAPQFYNTILSSLHSLTKSYSISTKITLHYKKAKVKQSAWIASLILGFEGTIEWEIALEKQVVSATTVKWNPD